MAHLKTRIPPFFEVCLCKGMIGQRGVRTALLAAQPCAQSLWRHRTSEFFAKCVFPLQHLDFYMLLNMLQAKISPNSLHCRMWGVHSLSLLMLPPECVCQPSRRQSLSHQQPQCQPASNLQVPSSVGKLPVCMSQSMFLDCQTPWHLSFFAHAQTTAMYLRRLHTEWPFSTRPLPAYHVHIHEQGLALTSPAC